MNFAVPANPRMIMKETIDKYLVLAKELKKLCHIKVTVIPFIDGVLGTISNDLQRRLV